MVWLESPTNPSMKVLDIAAISELARARGVPVAVDNSYASPYFQRPLALGADAGDGEHDQVPERPRRPDGRRDRDRRPGAGRAAGADRSTSAAPCPSPFDCWLLMRGIKTLALRMERHQATRSRSPSPERAPEGRARALPRPAEHPGHAIARRQMSGFSGMVTFELAAGPEAAQAGGRRDPHLPARRRARRGRVADLLPGHRARAPARSARPWRRACRWCGCRSGSSRSRT